LRYLPLFNTMNATLNSPGRVPKPLQTHGKRAAKKGGKAGGVDCYLDCNPSDPAFNLGL
jgi:hypothetical protein